MMKRYNDGIRAWWDIRAQARPSLIFAA